MRILSEGQLPEDRIWFGVCSRCGCTIQFLQSEGSFHQDQRDGESCTYPCPTKRCGTTIYGKLTEMKRLST